MKSEYWQSPVFGLIRDATESEQALIKSLVKECPAALFAELNRRLNDLGFSLSIRVET